MSTVAPLNRIPWLAVFTHCLNRVMYLLGGKFSPISIDTSKVSGCDCSGLVQKMIWEGAGVTIPAGSYDQQQYMIDHGLEVVPLAEAIADRENRVYIFYKLAGAMGDPYRHTGFFFNGQALQSYGGYGVGNTSGETVVKWGVSICYLWPSYIPSNPAAGFPVIGENGQVAS